MTDEADVLYEVRDRVATITLNRPSYRNAQSRLLINELDSAFARAADDDDVRVVVLAGSGPSFSAGHDTGTPAESEEVERRRHATLLEQSARSWRLYGETTMRWREVGKPTIARVQGYCVYAGWTIASAMDIIICASDAKFLPHLSEFFALPWIVGTRRAKQLLFTAEVLTAEEALEYGMVNEVVPADSLQARTDELAKLIAQNDPGLMRLVKASINGIEDGMGFGAAVRTAQAYNVMAYHHPGMQVHHEGGRDEITAAARSLESARDRSL
jgi:enoyl-CoA hydratase